MAGHSRSKNGVASLAYVPAIPLRRAPCLPYRDARDTPRHGDHAKQRDSPPKHEPRRRPAALPSGPLELGLHMLLLGKSETEIADEPPGLRHLQDRLDARRIEDRDPAHPDALGAR